jgi:hypothetical protein
MHCSIIQGWKTIGVVTNFTRFSRPDLTQSRDEFSLSISLGVNFFIDINLKVTGK